MAVLKMTFDRHTRSSALTKSKFWVVFTVKLFYGPLNFPYLTIHRSLRHQPDPQLIFSGVFEYAGKKQETEKIILLGLLRFFGSL